MSLSPREKQVLALLRVEPGLDAAALAVRLGTTKGAVAVTLSSLSRKGEILGRTYQLRPEAFAVVVGGAAWDVKARSKNPTVLQTSNPAVVTRTPGGVGRNIAENIARLGDRVHLIAAVGNDSVGRDLIKLTAQSGVILDDIIMSAHPTGSYLASLDSSGELVIGMGDFTATDSLTVAELAGAKELISRAQVVVVDANLPDEIISWVLLVSATAAVPTVVEPVSVAKAERLAKILNPERLIFVITPNLDELSALVGHEVPDDDEAIGTASRELHKRGVQHVWVSRGAEGSLLVSADADPLHIPALPTTVVDVTGAGDSMMAGFVHGILTGKPPEVAAKYGHLSAALTVASTHTSRPDLGEAFIEALQKYDQLIGETK